MCLKLRRECKDDYIKVGENKVYWLLEGGVGKGGQVLEEGAFQRCVDQQAHDGRNDGQGLLRAKISLLVKMLLLCLGCDCQP